MSDSQSVFRTEQHGSTLIVIPTDEHIGFRLKQIQDEADEIAGQVNAGEIKDVVVDASETPYLSSTVIGAFITIWDVLMEKGGKLALCNLTDDAMAAIVATRLDTKWSCVGTREEALQSLA